MKMTLIVLGVLIIILAVVVHWVIKGVTLFPHAALVIGAVGVIVAAIGIVMSVMRPSVAK